MHGTGEGERRYSSWGLDALVARGSVPTAETGGIEYRLRRSLADRLVVAAKPLLAGVVVERRGRLIGDVESINRILRGLGGSEDA